jgi:hypothetical protein
MLETALVMLVAGFALGMAAEKWRVRREIKHRPRVKPRPRAVNLLLLFGPIGEAMSKAVLHTDDTSVGAALVFKDKKGNVTSPAAPPVWSLGADGIVAMTVAADGLSAEFTPVAPGDVTVDVVAEGDAEPGVDTLHATGDLSVLPAEAATVDLSFGPVT